MPENTTRPRRRRGGPITAEMHALSRDLWTAHQAERTSSPPKSMAASFARNNWHPSGRLDAPPHIKRNRVALRLAHRGAMEPEGCTGEELIKVRHDHDLFPGSIHEIVKTLWQARLLGYVPGDLYYLTFDRLAELVREGTRRPADTADLIPERVRSRKTADEIEALRFGRQAAA